MFAEQHTPTLSFARNNGWGRPSYPPKHSGKHTHPTSSEGHDLQLNLFQFSSSVEGGKWNLAMPTFSATDVYFVQSNNPAP